METNKNLIIKKSVPLKQCQKREIIEKLNEMPAQNTMPHSHTGIINEMGDDCDFEQRIEDSMAHLDVLDELVIKTDSDLETTKIALCDFNSICKHPNDLLYQSKTKEIIIHKRNKGPSIDDSITEGNVISSTITSNAATNPFRSPEAIIAKLLPWQPFLIPPFQERRRLSQCKEEDEDDSEKNQNALSNKTRITGTKHKFIVTKTENIPRREVENLRNMTAKQNAATIHFPCSSTQQRTSLSSVLFSPTREFNPHLDKRYFDTSLVEIRSNSVTNSTTSLNKSNPTINNEPNNVNVWVPMAKKQIFADVSSFMYNRNLIL